MQGVPKTLVAEDTLIYRLWMMQSTRNARESKCSSNSCATMYHLAMSGHAIENLCKQW